LAEVSTESSDIGVSLFSALSKQGLGDVAETLYGWAHPQPKVAEAEGADQADEAAAPAALPAAASGESDR
jgi:GTP-binding protein